jgi:hypothetical protein
MLCKYRIPTHDWFLNDLDQMYNFGPFFAYDIILYRVVDIVVFEC